MKSHTHRAAVIGAGSWGTALANLLATKRIPTTLWSYEPELVLRLHTERCNALYLPDIPLSEGLCFTHDLCEALHEATIVVLAVPSHALRAVVQQLAELVTKPMLLVCATKGIEIGTNQLMGEVLTETLPHHPLHHITFLSGPSFAREVAEEQPTAVVIAGKSHSATSVVQELFRTDYLLTFTHEDVVGVQVGGAVKNVLAIAAGIAEGLGYRHNTQAALITRGLYEMIKFGTALGADPMTFSGLAGLGDLVLTCTGGLSRNRQVGIALGRGTPLEAVLRGMTMVAEGVGTAKAVHEIAAQQGLNMPICASIYDILYRNAAPRRAAEALTRLALTREFAALT